MGQRKYRNIAYDGRVFATAQDLAAYVGRTQQTVLGAVRNNRLHTLGVGQGHGATPMPVRIAGRDFASASEAAAFYGVTRKAVWAAIDAGDPDRLARPRRAVNAIAIAVGPLTFPSRTAASVALGFSAGYISTAIALKSDGMWQRILAAAMRLAADRDGQNVTEFTRERRDGSCTIGPVTFISQAAAAQALDCTPQNVRHALDGVSSRMLAVLEARAARIADVSTPHRTEDDMPKHLSWAERAIMKRIVAEVAARRGLAVKDIMGRRRHAWVSHPRQEAMALCSREGLPDDKVGRFFHRDRTTVIHARRAHAERAAADKAGSEGRAAA